MSISSGNAIAALAALLAVGALAGCGSSSSKDASGPPSLCESRAEGAARAAVIKAAYDAGQLGTAKQLATHFQGVAPTTYLNADGTLRPFSELKGNARLDFEAWMNEEVQNMDNKVGERVREASDRVRQSSISTGKPCKQVTQSS
jgi:hypothetical protein